MSRSPMRDTGIGVLDVGIARSGQISLDRASLEESDGLCRALLYAVSHDLRTPLTAIRTIAAALRSADLDTHQRDAMLADVDHQAERLARLLSKLLEAARVEADAVRPALVRVPVEELCRAAVTDASLGGRLVEIDLEPRLPPAEVDETMIRQALVNLLENAARHDPGPLAVRAARAGGYLEIRVIDHGPGVPASEQQRIFEAFQRLRERRRGTGLGLWITRGFLEAHRGDVRVEATNGGGATFVVSLPIR
jgi:two-component system, OmpR family, sensor histidine kinase KdpD